MYTHEEVRAIIKFVLEEERRLTVSEQTEQSEPVKADMPEVTAEEEKEVPPAPKKVKAKTTAPKRIDHGKIMALHKGKWPVAKIADEMGCSEQTVRNHIAMEEKKNGIG